MELSIFFEQLLGLSAPYKIQKIEQKKSPEVSAHLYVEISKDYRPKNESLLEGGFFKFSTSLLL